MKITIKAGESVENAMKYLQAFFDERKEEYPVLKSHMNVYVNIGGFGDVFSPDNEKILILNREGVIDAEEQLQEEARKAILDKWETFCKRNSKFREEWSILRDIEKDQKYIETAEEKGRRPDLVEKRKKKLQQNLERLEIARQVFEYIQRIISFVNENQKTIFYTKHRESRFGRMVMRAYIIIEGPGDFVGHFDGYEIRKSLPYKYVQTED